MVVYSLTDPNNLIIRYIGISKHTAIQRYRLHLKDAKTKLRKGLYISAKEQWILDLYRNNQTPIIKTEYQNLTEQEALDMEKKLIANYKRVYEGGTLYNVQEGGDYNSCLAKVWNKGLHNCYSNDFLSNNKIAQPNRKEVYRFDKNGVFIDKWISIRDMCAQLKLDRRAVSRCLHQEPNFISHKGFMFSHTPTPPIYYNKSSDYSYGNHVCAKPIIAIKNGQTFQYDSIRRCAEHLNLHPSSISVALSHNTLVHGYSFQIINNNGNRTKGSNKSQY